MLNHGLVQEFRRIHSQGLMGTLTVTYETESVRFFFRDGNLVLLDYCQDKELMLLMQYRAYHKIGPEIEALVTQLRQTQGIRIHDYLRSQQLVSDDEVEQVTRTLVEDKLCDWFGTPSTGLSFNPTETEQSFDIAHTAVKLRIDSSVLLQMVEVRIAERDAVRQEIRDWSMVYGLVEGAPDPDILNDMERNVLNLIDGRRSVEDLASAIRDSSLNTACYLISLSNQGFINRNRPTTERASYSGMRPAMVDPVQQVEQHLDPSAGPESRRPTIPDFQPIYRQEEQARSRAPLFILVVVLLVLGGVGALVWRSRTTFLEVDQSLAAYDRAMVNGAWSDAERLLGEAKGKAGQDKRLHERIQEAVAEVVARLQVRISEIRTRIADGEFAAAVALAEQLPGENQLPAEHLGEELSAGIRSVRSDIDLARQQAEDRADLLAEQVAGDLVRDRIDLALQRIEDAGREVGERARIQIIQWRGRMIDEAGDASLSLSQRQRLLDLVKQADPEGPELSSIARVQKEIDLAGQRLEKEIASLEAALQTGDYQAVGAQIGSAKLLAAGSDFAPRLGAIEQSAGQLEGRIEALYVKAMSQIRRGDDPAEIDQVLADLDREVQALPKLSRAREFAELKVGLLAVLDCLGAATYAAEITVLDQALSGGEIPGPVRQIFEERKTILQRNEQIAAEDFNNDILRALDQEGLDSAIGRLETFLQRKHIERTAIHERAREQLTAWHGRRKRNEQEMANLVEAMRQDDAQTVDTIAGRLNLPRLPVAVHSEPSGATVLIDGQVMGETPWVYQNTSPDRNQVRLTIRMIGYLDQEYAANEGVGGWKILAVLERSPLLSTEIPGPATSVPTWLQDHIWVAGSSGVSRVGLDGSSTTLPLSGEGIAGGNLREPVYARAVEYDDILFFTTRDGVLLQVADGTLERQPMAARSNFPLLRYVSPVVLDRELHIGADLGGQLLASDPRAGGVIWQTPKGQPFAMGPVLFKNFVLAVHVDGQLEVFQVENGISVSAQSLKEPVLAAWPAEEGVSGISRTASWHWQGESVSQVPLPNEALSAAEDIIVTTDYRVHIRAGDGVWTALGKLPRNEDRINYLLRWNDQAVVVQGQKLTVYGPRGFEIGTDKDFAQPAIADGKLVVVTTSGLLRLYAP